MQQQVYNKQVYNAAREQQESSKKYSKRHSKKYSNFNNILISNILISEYLILHRNKNFDALPGII